MLAIALGHFPSFANAGVTAVIKNWHGRMARAGNGRCGAAGGSLEHDVEVVLRNLWERDEGVGKACGKPALQYICKPQLHPTQQDVSAAHLLLQSTDSDIGSSHVC